LLCLFSACPYKAFPSHGISVLCSAVPSHGISILLRCVSWLIQSIAFLRPSLLHHCFSWLLLAPQGLSSAFLLSASPLPYSATLCPCL
jgi:hypothetical protein